MEQNTNNGISLKSRQQVADEYIDTTIKVLNGAIERHKLNILTAVRSFRSTKN